MRVNPLLGFFVNIRYSGGMSAITPIPFKQAMALFKKGPLPHIVLCCSDQLFIQNLLLEPFKKQLKNPLMEYHCYYGSECDLSQIMERLQTQTIGAQRQLIVVREAHCIDWKKTALFEKRLPSETTLFCIGYSQSNALKKCKNIPFDCVIESVDINPVQYLAWVKKLASLIPLELSNEQLQSLCMIEPWSLDRVWSELQKWQNLQPQDRTITLVCADHQQFMDAFWKRDKKQALRNMAALTEDIGEFAKHIGLIVWQARQLISFILSQKNEVTQLPRFSLQKAQVYARYWTYRQIQSILVDLIEIDYQTKQTRHTRAGLLFGLISKYCI